MHPSIDRAVKDRSITSGAGNIALGESAGCALHQFRATIADPGEIIARMLCDLQASPVLAAEDAPITREFFLNLGWTRQQIAAYAPRAIEQFREGA